jgi:hypothetical protein
VFDVEFDQSTLDILYISHILGQIVSLEQHGYFKRIANKLRHGA